MKNNNIVVNPFVTHLSINVNISTNYKKRENEFIEKAIELEADRYLKLFCYDSFARNLMKNLSPCSAKLMLWIMMELLPTEDVVRINKEKFKLESGIKSTTTVLQSIKDLIDLGVITGTSEKEIYWINPAIFFSGNRIRKYKDKATFNIIYID